MKFFVLLCAFLFSPSIIFVFANWNLKKQSVFVKFLVLVTLFSCVITGITYLILKRFSYYEWLAFECALAIVLSFLVVIIVKKQMLMLDILKIVALISIVVALYSIMSRGQTIIHSDTATATLLTQSQLRHKSLCPMTWNYANGSLMLFFVNLILIPLSFVSNNQTLIRVASSAVWVMIAVFSIYCLSKIVFNDHSWCLSIPFFLLFLWGEIDMILYEAAYTGHMFYICFSSVLVFSIFKDIDRHGVCISCFMLHKRLFFKIVALFFCMFIMAVGGQCFWGEVIVPMVLTVIVFQIFKMENNGNVLTCLVHGAFLIFIILIPALVGAFYYHSVAITHNMNNNNNNFLLFSNNYSENFFHYFVNHWDNVGFHTSVKPFELLGLHNLVSIFFTIVICFIVPVLQFIKIKRESDGVILFFLFAIIHNVINFILVVFFDLTTVRYCLSSVMMDLLLSSRYIFKYWICDVKKCIGNLISLIVMFAVCINSLHMFSFSDNWRNVLNHERNVADFLVRTGCKKGYASFWNAYSNEVYSDCEIRFGAVKFSGANLRPQYWLVDSDVYDFKNNEPSLLLLSSDEMGYADKGNIEAVYGKPIKVLTYDRYTAFLFDYDIASKFIGVKPL